MFQALSESEQKCSQLQDSSLAQKEKHEIKIRKIERKMDELAKVLTLKDQENYELNEKNSHLHQSMEACKQESETRAEELGKVQINGTKTICSLLATLFLIITSFYSRHS